MVQDLAEKRISGHGRVFDTLRASYYSQCGLHDGWISMICTGMLYMAPHDNQFRMDETRVASSVFIVSSPPFQKKESAFFALVTRNLVIEATWYIELFQD